ncbi:conjugal transfer protein TraB [Micromonospora zingiberis]|uniref:Conjugal transfer protein TraB n=1 Tax=Micromonospora zingiberis TaxID=2053011 RepID=A0A4V2LWS0_9ACTN|nr:conjugal transfer protein TraB [Micromonospora zingiberis]TCB97595.1 conjugal transfer protein TraB [Micromonospora zingiberis]
MAKTTTRMPRNAGYDGVATVHTVRIPLWPYLVTPASAVGLWAATAGAHAYWADSPAVAGAAAAGLTLAGTALTGLTWRAAAARGIVRQATATLSCVAGSAWTIGAMLAGPWERPWLDMWLIGAPVASIAMAVVRVMRSGGSDEQADNGSLKEAVKSLRSARIGQPKVDGARATAPVVLEPGVTASDLAGERGALASALDVSPTAVRVIPNPDSARRATVSVVPVDQLKETRYWPGPSAPGASIADAPTRLGVMEDGEPLEIWLPGDHSKGRNSAHLSVVGMSGAGKTELVLNLCADLLTRTDVRLIITDTRKGDQLPEWLRKGAHETHLDAVSAEDFIESLPQVIAQRARHLGQRGLKQWVKGCGLDYWAVVNFEAARLVSESDSFVDITESARSVGIFLLVELQRATHDRFPTSARANISARVCLGVARDDDAEAALSESTLDSGAAPWEWKNGRPGYLYAELPGVDQERWSMPARAFIARSEDDRAAVVAQHRQTSANRPSPTPRREDPVDPPATPPAGEDQEERVLNRALDLTDPPDDVDPSQPIAIPADMPRLALGQLRTPPMGTEEARAWMRDYLLRLHDAGTDQIRPAELGDVIEATGLTAAWVGKELRRLCSGPGALLQKTDRGVYRIRIPEPAQ